MHSAWQTHSKLGLVSQTARLYFVGFLVVTLLAAPQKSVSPLSSNSWLPSERSLYQ